jgi:dolichol-phosphate mannosyltransferase
VSDSTPEISIVVPVYRAERFLVELFERIKAALDGAGRTFELILVDDGSPDDAWKTIGALAEKDRRVRGLRLSRNFGQHPAIAAGFDHARGEKIVLMDSDLQDRPEDLPRLVAALGGDVDVVYTVKQTRSDPPLTRLTSHLYHFTFAKLSGTQVPRNIGTYRVFSRRFLEAIHSYPERNVLFGPLMFHIGFKHTVIEVEHAPRPGGGSEYNFAKRLKLAVSSLMSYSDLPHRFLVWIGTAILAGTFIYANLLIAYRLFSGKTLPSGLTLLAFLITITLGCVMLSLGIIGGYVFRVYQEVLARPRYVISRKVNG